MLGKKALKINLKYTIIRYCFYCGKKIKIKKYPDGFLFDKFCSIDCDNNHRGEVQRKYRELRNKDKWNSVLK